MPYAISRYTRQLKTIPIFYKYLHQSIRIAIYHGFPDIHFEMLGYVIKYCLCSGKDFTVFANSGSKMANMWKTFYDDVFGYMEWVPTLSYNPTTYDHVILLTDDDPIYANSHGSKERNKVLTINHCHDVRFPGAKAYILDIHQKMHTLTGSSRLYQLLVWLKKNRNFYRRAR